LDKLDAAQASEAGILLRRAIEIRAALKAGLLVGLEEICADEFAAIQALEEAQAKFEQEKLEPPGQ
jgi:hypothetical protein